MKWPELRIKKSRSDYQYEDSYKKCESFSEGWNAAIEACKESHDEQCGGLVQLDYDKLTNLRSYYFGLMLPRDEDFMMAICSKFGIRPLPSVEEIERLISFQDLWITHPQRPQRHKRKLAQAIHTMLKEKSNAN